jgi:hypothetical protein
VLFADRLYQANTMAERDAKFLKMLGSQAVEFILAGATAVQIGTANFVDPFVWTKVLAGLEDYLDRHNVERLAELIGAFDPTPPKAVHA